MRKIKVGDIVKGKRGNGYSFTNENMTKGKVISVDKDGYIKVEVLEHSIDTEIGWEYNSLNPYKFDLVYESNKQEIHITTEETTTHAILKENGKVVNRSKAMCNPDDTYDFETGVRLAVDRLFGKEVKSVQTESDNNKKRTFKAKCVDDYNCDGIAKKGKVYEFINGVAMLESGRSSTYFSFEDFIDRNPSLGKWELVEDTKQTKLYTEEEVIELIRKAMKGE